MALRARYIADKSALARLRHPQVAAVLSPLILGGDLATCSLVELEILYSTRGHEDLVKTRAIRSCAFPLVNMAQADFDRAVEVMERLARSGRHRAVGIPDLLIAAVAEREHLTIIRYDADYEIVSAATGQPTQWVVARGSIP